VGAFRVWQACSKCQAGASKGGSASKEGCAIRACKELVGISKGRLAGLILGAEACVAEVCRQRSCVATSFFLWLDQWNVCICVCVREKRGAMH